MSTSDTHALLLLVTSNGIALKRSIDYCPVPWIFAPTTPVHALRAYSLRCTFADDHRRRPSQQNKDHRPGPKLTRLCRRPSRKALYVWSTSTIGSAMLTCGEGGEGFCTIGSELKAWFRTKSGAGTAYGRC